MCDLSQYVLFVGSGRCGLLLLYARYGVVVLDIVLLPHAKAFLGGNGLSFCQYTGAGPRELDGVKNTDGKRGGGGLSAACCIGCFCLSYRYGLIFSTLRTYPCKAAQSQPRGLLSEKLVVIHAALQACEVCASHLRLSDLPVWQPLLAPLCLTLSSMLSVSKRKTRLQGGLNTTYPYLCGM